MAKKQEQVNFVDLLRALIVVANDPNMDDEFANEELAKVYDAAVVAIATMRVSTCIDDLASQEDGPVTVYTNQVNKLVKENMANNTLTTGIDPGTGKVIKRLLRPRVI